MPTSAQPGHCAAVTEKAIELDLDDAGVASRLPRPQHRSDEVQQVPIGPFSSAMTICPPPSSDPPPGCAALNNGWASPSM